MNVARRCLLTSRIFQVDRLTYTDSRGRELTRDIVSHPGSVAIVPLIDRDRVCLIRNFRPGVMQTLVELPAGTREEGEAPQDTARRELQEETGYSAAHLEYLLGFHVSPGILAEQMSLYLATGLTPGPPQREPGEEIENLVATRAEVMEWIRDGTICDAKTLVGLLWWNAQCEAADR